MNENPINRAAFDWLVRGDAGLNPAQQAELQAWLDADPRHYGAYMRAKAVFAQGRRIKAFSHSSDPDSWMAYARPDDGVALAGDEAHAAADPSPRPALPVARRAVLGLAGSVVVAGVAAALFGTSQPAHALTFQTRRGERRDIVLTDGSRVALNTDSELRVLFDDRRRVVQLVRGEALCTVSPDRARPFIVDAAGFKVRAEAASFAVQAVHGAPPRVIVKQGAVDVIPDHSTSVKVVANTKVTFVTDSNLSGAVLSPEQLDRELLWREGKIAFDDTPLRSAIVAFDRYGPVHIRVDDPELLDQTVTGVFASDDPMGFARVVGELFDARAVPDGQGIALRRSR